MMRFLLELIYPRRAVCMGCGSMIGCERRDVCSECRQKLAKDWIGVRHTKAIAGWIALPLPIATGAWRETLCAN